jgi:hypothetical protein
VFGSYSGPEVRFEETLCFPRSDLPERRLNQAARWRTLQRARRMRRELFLFVEEGGDGFLFLLDDASDIGGDIRIPGCPNDPQGHASGVF